MIVAADLPEKRQFLDRNKAFWAEHPLPAPTGGGTVLVELMHYHAAVVAMNILTARAIAAHNGWTMLGVVSSSAVGNPPLSMNALAEYASSFGVTEFVVQEETVRPDHEGVWPALTGTDGIVELRGAALRSALMELRCDGILVGDLLIDQFVRDTGLPTVQEWHPRLGYLAHRARHLVAQASAWCGRYPIKAVVTCHNTYLDYAVLARVAVARGAHWFGKIGLDPVIVRRFRNETQMIVDGVPLSDADLKTIQDLYGTEKYNALADAYFPPKVGDAGRAELSYLKHSNAADKMNLDRERLIDALGVPADRPCVLFAAHQFTDAPHVYPNHIFSDYGDWLERSLAFAETQTTTTWLVKRHPYEYKVGRGAAYDRIVTPFVQRNDHIVDVPVDHAIGSLVPLVAAVVTVAGTVSLEFATSGVPCIIAGRPMFARDEFLHLAKDWTHYSDLLARAHRFERLEKDRIDLAKRITFLYFRHSYIQSQFIPEMPDLFNHEGNPEINVQYWREAQSLIGKFEPNQDRYYVAMRQMLDRNSDILLDLAVKD